MLVIPLRFNRRCFGVLALANPVHGGAFSPTDFELIQWLAEQASLALHNADFLNLHLEKREMDLDFSLASSIQKMLLPSHAPVVASLEVGFKYIPAQRIGGDLYDFIPLPGGKLGVVIADVSGKGLPASILMTSCRSTLRQIAPRHESPAAVLRELNESLIADVQPGMFITMVYVVLDARAGRIHYARAGHELPLLLKAPRPEQRGQDQFEFLEGDGLPLGMVAGELFDRYIEERTSAFEEGDVLVLYTDGITEAPNAEDKEYSGARLADVLTRRGRQTADELVSEVLSDLSVFAEGRAQRDDYTIVALRRL